LAQGLDPREEVRKREAEELRKRRTTFAAVVEDFVREKLPGQEVERLIRRDLMPSLGTRPITEIDEEEIAAVVRAKARRTPTTARQLLIILRRLFVWAREQMSYGLQQNPCIEIRANSLCGPPRLRSRVLTDDELFALWRAADREGYPGGAVYKLLMLSGLRLNEVCDARKPNSIGAPESGWFRPSG